MRALEKTCKKHGVLEEKNIRIRGDRPHAIHLLCRLCQREKSSKHRELNRDKVNEDQRRIYANNIDKQRERSKIKYRKFRTRAMETYIKKTYGLEAEKYWKMVEEQENRCKICNKEETRKSCGDFDICRLAIDHDHKTGKIRSLLCSACNTGIGKFKEDHKLLQKAIEYLKSHQ